MIKLFVFACIIDHWDTKCSNTIRKLLPSQGTSRESYVALVLKVSIIFVFAFYLKASLFIFGNESEVLLKSDLFQDLGKQLVFVSVNFNLV